MKILKIAALGLLLGMSNMCSPAVPVPPAALTVDSEIFNTAEFITIKSELKNLIDNEKSLIERLVDDFTSYPFRYPRFFTLGATFFSSLLAFNRKRIWSLGLLISRRLPYFLVQNQTTVASPMKNLKTSVKPTLLDSIKYDLFGTPLPTVSLPMAQVTPQSSSFFRFDLKKIDSTKLLYGASVIVLMIIIWRWAQQYERKCKQTFATLVEDLKKEIEGYETYFEKSKNVRGMANKLKMDSGNQQGIVSLKALLASALGKNLEQLEAIVSKFRNLKEKLRYMPDLDRRCAQFIRVTERFNEGLTEQRDQVAQVSVR